jgi:hypothetical protein
MRFGIFTSSVGVRAAGEARRFAHAAIHSTPSVLELVGVTFAIEAAD